MLAKVMTEKDMFKYLHKVEPRFKAQAIESAITGIGIPDWWFAIGLVHGWIEAKSIKREVKGRFKIQYRPGQLPWHIRWMKRAPTCPIVTALYLNDFIYFKDRNLKEFCTVDEIKNEWYRLDENTSVFYILNSIQKELNDREGLGI